MVKRQQRLRLGNYRSRVSKGVNISMKNNGTAYMIFVLGYDLLQKELASYNDCPCDLAYEICCDIYNEFLDSEEAEQDKSEYECLQEWIENHQGTIDRLIETNFRLVED